MEINYIQYIVLSTVGYVVFALIIHLLSMFYPIPIHRLIKYRIKKEYSKTFPDHFFIYVQQSIPLFGLYANVKVGDKWIVRDMNEAETVIKQKKEKAELEYQQMKNKKKDEYIYIKDK